MNFREITSDYLRYRRWTSSGYQCKFYLAVLFGSPSFFVGLKLGTPRYDRRELTVTGRFFRPPHPYRTLTVTYVSFFSSSVSTTLDFFLNAIGFSKSMDD